MQKKDSPEAELATRKMNIEKAIGSLKEIATSIIKELSIIKEKKLYKLEGFTKFESFAYKQGYYKKLGLESNVSINNRILAYKYTKENKVDFDPRNSTKIVQIKNKGIKGKKNIEKALIDKRATNGKKAPEDHRMFKVRARIPNEFYDSFMENWNELVDEYCIKVKEY